MNVISFDIIEKDIVMKTQSGIVEICSPCRQLDGYNMTKYCGYLLANRQHCECVVEIYHEGDMVFVSED